MNSSVKGALILLTASLVVLMGIYLAIPLFQEKEQVDTSDAADTKGKITIAVDNWIGYFPLRSPEMKRRMRQHGWNLVCNNDGANYSERMRLLSEGKLDAAVVTVDSYILNAASYNYPGVITFVIDESKGGDAIVADRNKIPNLEALRDRKDVRVGFTPDSPSSHLAKVADKHFSLPSINPRKENKVEFNGSEDGLKKLLGGEVDVAVLWEPDVSKALENANIVKIFDTGDTSKVIVDIFVFNREFLREHPEVVLQFMDCYFRTLKKFNDSPDFLRSEIKRETGLADDKIEVMLKGVKWVNFTENCEKWFGVSSSGNDLAEEGLVVAIDAAVDVLVANGDFDNNPIPDEDPYRLLNSSFLEKIFQRTASGITVPGAASGGSIGSDFSFAPLSGPGWNSLSEFGKLNVDPIIFQSGTNNLSFSAKEAIDKAVEKMALYPMLRVEIRGHTGTRGDTDANQKLSKNRADAVFRYMQITGVDENRIRAIGLGGEDPLPRDPGESKRAYEYRLPRVELVLMKESY